MSSIRMYSLSDARVCACARVRIGGFHSILTWICSIWGSFCSNLLFLLEIAVFATF